MSKSVSGKAVGGKARLILSVMAAAAAIPMSAGCVATVKKDSTFHGKQMPPAETRVYIAADLAVAEKKVIGAAMGYYENKGRLENAAVQDAFSRDPSGPHSADILVAPSFFYEHDVSGGMLTVTVVGYPARYKNFRPDPKLKNNAAVFIESTGGAFAAYPVQRGNENGSREKSAAQTPTATGQPVYHTPAIPPQPVYQAPPAPVPSTEQSPATNKPKE